MIWQNILIGLACLLIIIFLLNYPKRSTSNKLVENTRKEPSNETESRLKEKDELINSQNEKISKLLKVNQTQREILDISIWTRKKLARQCTTYQLNIQNLNTSLSNKEAQIQRLKQSDVQLKQIKQFFKNSEVLRKEEFKVILKESKRECFSQERAPSVDPSNSDFVAHQPHFEQQKSAHF